MRKLFNANAQRIERCPSGHRARKRNPGFVALGASNKEIAEYLRIRVSTVKFHIAHILSKLQISSRQDLFTDDFRRILNNLPRSEEHTSELQSQSNLVCRL